ncbi:hypothetical protein AaE_003697, partial [Aphanomyces astaci]
SLQNSIHHSPAINANAVLNRLQDQSIRDRSYLDVEYGSNDEVLDEVNLEEVAANPIMERFTTDLGTDGIRALTNFTVSEFESLWSFVDDAMNNARMEGRGHRCATSPKEALFMALTVLKHYCTWEKHAVDFGFKAPTFQKLIMCVLAVIEPVLSGRRFDNFPYALYAVDVKCQPSLWPTGRFSEQKHYYSGKHNLYGYKIEAAVSPDGRCVAMSASHPGSVHDLTIMHSRVKDHEANLAKSPSDAALPDHGELSNQFRGSWACLVDMGYIGIQHSLRGIHPKRRPVNGSLGAEDLFLSHTK